MSESIASELIIQAYANDHNQSKEEFEGEDEEFQSDDDDLELQEQHSIEARLEQNQSYMDEEIAASDWEFEPHADLGTEGVDTILIKTPLASKLSHRLINPNIYRRIKKVKSLDDLATFLQTQDWEKRRILKQIKR
jgi:hypothetical protein